MKSSFDKWGRGNNGSLIFAYLGPTNTGKTYRAIQRMIELGGGCIGLPLRLLAREVYERLAEKVGNDNVGLITGEERILPRHYRYLACTVESMPTQEDFPIVIVDEIQLATHPKRGHIFTDRLLHIRGITETWFLGSDTMTEIIQDLVPTAKITQLKRLSKLNYLQPKKLGSLPKRSAIISFNITHLYEIAERIRSSRGGVAIVMGAMSPQARNAQVELFQSGKVDYLIATDAIGLGLNLDIKHVCFASLRKFDGKEYRDLTLPEIGQIAGRAGRYQRDGSFNLSLDCTQRHFLSDQAVQYIEAQQFLPVRKIYYRNSNLNFESVDRLLSSLQKRPFRGCMLPQREALDEQALLFLLKDEDIQKKLDSPLRIEFLWQICRIPDYQQETQISHFRFLKRIYLELTTGDGVLPDPWVSQQAKKLGNLAGDIPQLLRQMASVRTWSYISHRLDWLRSPEYWIMHFKELEETLAATLHERLTQRFIDELNSPEERPIPFDLHVEDGVLWSKQMLLGYLVSFSFRSNWTADAYFGNKIVRSLGLKYLTPIAKDDYRKLMKEKNWHLRSDFQIYYQDIPLGKLKKGKNIRSPQISLRSMELLEPRQKTHLQMALQDWLRDHIQPFFQLFSNPKPELRDIHLLLQNHLGYIPKKSVPSLSPKQRKTLHRSKLIFGKKGVYNPQIYKLKFQITRFMLYAVWYDFLEIPSHPEQAVCYKIRWPKGFGRVMGYTHSSGYWIRDDILDKIYYRRPKSELAISWLGLKKEQWKKIAKSLGIESKT